MADDRNDLWRLAASYSAVGIEMVIAVAVGAVGGGWLDKKFGTAPYLFWFGLVVGIGAAANAIIRMIRRYKRESGD